MIRTASLAAAAAVACLPAFAAEPIAGPEIRETVAGMTIEGSMVDSGRYSEFYDADGTIRGDGYTASWSVEDDAMCFDYGSGPVTCWQVGRSEGEVLWLRDGEVRGSGTLREGNPNGY